MTSQHRHPPNTVATLVAASARYWTTVAPVVQRELHTWRAHASAINDPVPRMLALSKLEREQFNAEAGAMIATSAPRAARSHVARAIVALEVLFDYLDGLSETTPTDSEQIFKSFTAAVAAEPSASFHGGEQDAHAYLSRLSQAVSREVAVLPAYAHVAGPAAGAAERAIQAQSLLHCDPRAAEQWARIQTAGDLGWREQLASGGASVLTLHALITAAADPQTTTRDAHRLAHAYQPICAVLALLDSAVDVELDRATGANAYADAYTSPAELAETLTRLARIALARTSELDNASHHAMILAAGISFYASAPGADSELAQPALTALKHELGPLLTAPRMLLRAWRAAQRRQRAEHKPHSRPQPAPDAPERSLSNA